MGDRAIAILLSAVTLGQTAHEGPSHSGGSGA